MKKEKFYWRWKDSKNITNIKALEEAFKKLKPGYPLTWVFNRIGLPDADVGVWKPEIFTEDYEEALHDAILLGLVETSDNPYFIVKTGIVKIPVEELMKELPAWYKNELLCALLEDAR